VQFDLNEGGGEISISQADLATLESDGSSAATDRHDRLQLHQLINRPRET